MHFKAKPIIQRLKLEKKNSITVRTERQRKPIGKDCLKTVEN